jgi:hypothetical protein
MGVTSGLIRVFDDTESHRGFGIALRDLFAELERAEYQGRQGHRPEN